MTEFRILGPLEAVEEDGPLALGGPRQRSLLAILLLRRGEVVSADRLIDELWNQRPPPTAAKTLQGYVSHLRKALGPDVLLTRNGGYLLDAPELDAERFDALVEQAHATRDPATQRALLTHALGLWRGEALSDLAYEPFAQPTIARLEEARLAALEDRIDADLELGRHRELVGELESLVRAHPGRERLVGQLMLSLYRGGRHTEALEVYRRGRTALQDELGLEPGPELRALERRILDHDPQLTPRTTARAGTRHRLLLAGAALVVAVAIVAGLATRGHAVPVRVHPNSVVAIDPSDNRIAATVPVGASPGPLAVQGNSLWVGNLDDQTVSRVDTHSQSTVHVVPVSDPPTALAVAGGRVWVAGSSADQPWASVTPIDPQFNALGRATRIGILVPGSPVALATSGEALDVAPDSGPLVTLDPSGRIVRRTDPNDAPTAIAAQGGAVWLTDSDAGNVTRVDPTGVVSSLAVGDEPSGIAAGAGAIWVAYGGDDLVARIDPGTHAVTQTIHVGHEPAGVAVGAGSVWVADSGDGTVMRIDPRSGRRLARIVVGGSPQAIAFAGGRAWVSDDERTIPPTTGDGTLRLDSPTDASSMDPALVYDGRADLLLYETCAMLLDYPDKGGAAGAVLVPEVAQALPRISPDRRTYTFTIRPGYRFSPPSNAPVTAETFKASFERSLSPRMHSPIAPELDDIVGARAYEAGRAARLAGVTASGDTLTIRLGAPEGDFLARIAQRQFCAVPQDTPLNPRGVREIPMAGPYRIADDTPGQGVVLTRNPNYHGPRPRNFARIVFATGMTSRTAVEQVERGRADLTGDVPSSEDARLTKRYGAKRYFASTVPQLDFFALNSHRPLFADVRLRQAVNYAIDRTALDRLGDAYLPLPEHETDHYLPPGIPGYRDTHVYPATPDETKARALAAPWAGDTVVLYTCDQSPCPQQAQIVRTDLARIGLHVRVRATPYESSEIAKPGEPWDMAWDGWLPDYVDPSAMLNALLDQPSVLPVLKDPRFQARLAAADRLSGTPRYLAYAQLDSDLARQAAPLVAFGNLTGRVFYSARIGCEQTGVYGVDLGALCVRR